MRQTELHSYTAYCACTVQHAGPYYTPGLVRFILRGEGGHIDFTVDRKQQNDMFWSHLLLIKYKGKVTSTLWHARKTGGGSRGKEVQLYPFNLNARWGGWLTPRPGHCILGKETRYLLCRRLVGPQLRSGWVQKISLPPGFDSRTVQCVASRSTDHTIPAFD